MTSRLKSGLSSSATSALAVLLGPVMCAFVMAADGSTAPANLRASIYSPGVFEIFWDRDPESEFYIIRDSSGDLQYATDGTSYFFDHDAVFSGPAVYIEVASMNVDGELSDAASLHVEISDGGSDAVSPPVVALPADTQNIFGSYEGGLSVLQKLNELVLGNALNTEVLDRYRQINMGYGLSELWEKGFVITTIDQGGYDTLSYSKTRVDCPDGGHYLVTQNSSASGRNSVYDYEMNACSFDGVVHAGNVKTYIDESNFFPDFAGSFLDYTLEYTDGRRITVDTETGPSGEGVYSRNVNLLSLERNRMTVNPRHFLRGQYTVTEADGNTMTVENALLDWKNNSSSNNCVEMSMRVSAPWTGYQTLQVDTYDDNWEKGAICDDSADSPYLSSGALSISDGTGRSITLSPRGESGYNLMIADSPSSSKSRYSLPWTDDECVLLDDESVNCEGVPPLY